MDDAKPDSLARPTQDVVCLVIKFQTLSRHKITVKQSQILLLLQYLYAVFDFPVIIRLGPLP